MNILQNQGLFGIFLLSGACPKVATSRIFPGGMGDASLRFGIS
jgi:hypothetical protein